MRKWQIISDEYPVENTHSIICAQTQETDTADNLSKKSESYHSIPTKLKKFPHTLHSTKKVFVFHQADRIFENKSWEHPCQHNSMQLSIVPVTL
jgi:hypothetical protein